MVLVRSAVLADAESIARIQVETWRAAYTGLMPEEVITSFDLEVQQRMWREGLGREPRPGGAVFVAELDDEVVGFASVGACRDEDGVAELYAIYVHPTCWDCGAGRALIQAAEESMRGSGFHDAMLWVLEGNERGERFYRAAGWAEDGKKDEEFQGAEVTELRYRKRL